MQDGVSIHRTVNEIEVVISPKIIVAAIGCPEESLAFDKDWEKEIS